MTVLDYLDFDLELTADDTGYRTRLIDSPVGEAEGTFVVPFSDEALENFVLKVGRTRVGVRRVGSTQQQAAETFGTALFDALLSGELRSSFGRSIDAADNAGRGLRIRLRLSDAPGLADIPWEYLYWKAQRRFLVLSSHTPLVRYVDLPRRIRPLTVTAPLRILMVVAGPKDLAPLDVVKEQTNIQVALAPLIASGLVELVVLSTATLGELQRVLRGSAFHVLHFVGHGGYDVAADGGVLAFENDKGYRNLVSGDILATILCDHSSLRLAVLNACEGARTSRSDPFAGVAQSLVCQGIPAVIAMQFEFTDAAALSFSSELYLALLDGYPVDAALAEARRAVLSGGNDVEWGTPVLYLRAKDGRIFDVLQHPTRQLKTLVHETPPGPVVGPLPGPAGPTDESSMLDVGLSPVLPVVPAGTAPVLPSVPAGTAPHVSAVPAGTGSDDVSVLPVVPVETDSVDGSVLPVVPAGAGGDVQVAPQVPDGTVGNDTSVRPEVPAGTPSGDARVGPVVPPGTMNDGSPALGQILDETVSEDVQVQTEVPAGTDSGDARSMWVVPAGTTGDGTGLPPVPAGTGTEEPADWRTSLLPRVVGDAVGPGSGSAGSGSVGAGSVGSGSVGSGSVGSGSVGSGSVGSGSVGSGSAGSGSAGSGSAGSGSAGSGSSAADRTAGRPAEPARADADHQRLAPFSTPPPTVTSVPAPRGAPVTPARPPEQVLAAFAAVHPVTRPAVESVVRSRGTGRPADAPARPVTGRVRPQTGNSSRPATGPTVVPRPPARQSGVGPPPQRPTSPRTSRGASSGPTWVKNLVAVVIAAVLVVAAVVIVQSVVGTDSGGSGDGTVGAGELSAASGRYGLTSDFSAFAASPQLTADHLIAGRSCGVKAVWQLAWDSEALSFLVQVTDNAVNAPTGSPSQLFKTDSVNLELGPGAGDLSDSDGLRDTDRHILLAPDGQGSAVAGVNVPSGGVFVGGGSTAGIQAVTAVQGSGYAVAGVIPWSVTGLTPEAGVPLAANLNVSSADGNGSFECFLSTNADRTQSAQNHPHLWQQLDLTP